MNFVINCTRFLEMFNLHVFAKYFPRCSLLLIWSTSTYLVFFCFPIIVYTDPWISCPIDRVEELEPDKSTVVLGYKWQLPRTNMHSVSVSPSNYDENYPLPVGRHRVTWTGISGSGTHKSCSFHITVNGNRKTHNFWNRKSWAR